MSLILLTRPLEDSRRIADLLIGEGDETGNDSLIWPLFRIDRVISKDPWPASLDALLITSAHGIRGFAAQREARDLPVLCVGARTASVARGLGFKNTFSANGDASALADMARLSGARRLLHPCGRETTGDLAGALVRTGQKVFQRVVYEAVPAGPPPSPVLAALRRGAFDAVTIWSPRNARYLAERIGAAGDWVLGQATLIAISQAAAGPLGKSGFSALRVADAPNANAMVAAIREVCA
ncbi:MAG: uroporphyrinogen-III synthase [Pseudomonadota bacterium]